MNEIKRDELKQLIDSRQTIGENSSILLIDVREPMEVQTYGSIPTSINIPMNDVAKELSLTPDAFKQKYGKVISKDKKIIFYCRSGTRAEFNTKQALDKGYVNATLYKGSALEWAEIDFNVKKY
jgi:thiosulfate:glutathione sulfurtransferase